MKFAFKLAGWSWSLILVVLSCLTPAVAQSPIRFVKASQISIRDAGTVTYVVGINEQGMTQHIYWGGHVGREEDFAMPRIRDWSGFDLSASTTPKEYPGWGAGLYVEPSLKVTFPDGNRDLVLHYVAHQIAGNTLTVTLKDIERPLLVHLHYTVYPQTGMLRREVTIENRTDKAVMLESAQSAACYLPQRYGFPLPYLPQRWTAN